MERSISLVGETVFITGASTGLGRALAEAFGAAGARVAVCARREGELREVVRSIQSSGGEAMGRSLDVTDAPAVWRFTRAVAQAWGPVSTLVNNASLLDARVSLAQVRPDDWRRVLDVNLTGALLTAQAVLPGMRQLGRGSIINVTSGVGNEARANWGAYAVSKRALEGLTWNLALEERHGGVRVNAVDPGRMRTEMRMRAYPEEDPETLPEPYEVVPVFLWLASEDSAGVTGRRFEAQSWGA